ncbi:MAG: transglycosylase domain-containing protein, partial [Clostridia bacterium]|nr:transglycosylase domain-containing protein [Clostridia bacterium]
KEGGSTISQQLIKNTHLTSEKSFERKISEARLAIQLERQYEKDEILSMYLNVLYFGSGVYGVKNAAKVFFDKEVDELSIAECATLAGIVKSPTKYNPINNYDNCMQRKCVVLDIMQKCGAIDSNECENAKKQEIIIKNTSLKNNPAEKYLICAIEECSDILGLTMQQIVYGDYIIDTYMDNSAMNALSYSVGNDSYLIANNNGVKPDAMGIIADNTTGGITAFYSNCDYSPHKTRRQPGSTIKPLACYLPALENGIISPISVLVDESTDFNGYSPSNYGGVYLGKVSARQALAKSLNIPAVKLMDLVGINSCCNMLSAMNIKLDKQDYNYSTALGGMTYGTTATELVGGYMMLANGGKYVCPTFISKIYDDSGKLIYMNSNERRKIVSEESAYLLSDMLKSTVKEGTASKLSSQGYEIAAKTGTVSYSANSSFNTDAYCISYTSSDTLMVWQGNLSGKTDKMLSSKVTGGGSPALMSRLAYSKLYSQYDLPMDFAIPDNVEQLDIDKIAYEAGEVILASSHAPKKYTITEIFDKRYKPMMQDTTYDNPCVTSYRLENTNDNKIRLSIN